jgi:hypothetical protein
MFACNRESRRMTVSSTPKMLGYLGGIGRTLGPDADSICIRGHFFEKQYRFHAFDGPGQSGDIFCVDFFEIQIIEIFLEHRDYGDIACLIHLQR